MRRAPAQMKKIVIKNLIQTIAYHNTQPKKYRHVIQVPMVLVNLTKDRKSHLHPAVTIFLSTIWIQTCPMMRRFCVTVTWIRNQSMNKTQKD